MCAGWLRSFNVDDDVESVAHPTSASERAMLVEFSMSLPCPPLSLSCVCFGDTTADADRRVAVVTPDVLFYAV